MPKLQILLDKGNVTFDNNNKWKRFWLLNFPRDAILDFMMSLHCLYCWKAEVLLFATVGQCSNVMKSMKSGNLKAEIFSVYYYYYYY